MMNKILHSFLYFFITIGVFSIPLHAQSFTLEGRLTAASDGANLVGATVFITALQKGTFTNENGEFSFSNIPGGEYTLSFSMLGYKTNEITTELDESFLPLVVSLEESMVNLTEIIIQEQKDFSNTISTISKIDLALRPTKSSQDILRMVPGLFTAQHAGGGKSEQIFLRGFDIDHGTDIRISVDGMPVNMVSHAHGQGYADLHFLIPETIQKVDFNKGPYYAKQGDFTTAGYVDFNTLNALENSSIKLEAGRFDTYRTVGLFNLLNDEERNQKAYLATELLFTNGSVESPQNFNRINVVGKFSSKITENQFLKASLSHFTSSWDASGQVPGRAVASGQITRFGSLDDSEGGQTSRTNLNVELYKTLAKGGFLKNQFFYIKNQFQLFSNFTFFLNDPIYGDQIQQSENRNVYGYQLSYTQDKELGSTTLESEIGFNLRFDQAKGTDLSHTYKRNTFLNYYAHGDIDELNAGFYINEKWKLSNQMTIVGGLRYDHFKFGYVNLLDSIYLHQQLNKGVVSPKLSLFYNIRPDFQLYIKGGVGFHSNDARLVVANSNNHILPKAYGLDIGVFAKPIDRLFINAAVWGLDLEQEFVYVGDEAVVEPSGKTRRYGADLSARWQITNWLFFDTDINITVPRSKEGDEGQNYIPLAPTFTSIGGLTTRFENGFNASVRYRKIGDRPANEDNSVVAKGYFLLDAELRYSQRKYELGLSFENILNVEWNEAQFDTETRLFNEQNPVSELHFTPGTPFFVKGSVLYKF